MNILLWILQGLLAFHTIAGAVWKITNPAQTVPSLSAIPKGVWTGLSLFEVLCGVGLVLPALLAAAGSSAPIAAACIAVEMLLFSAVHLASGAKAHGPMYYWLGVAALCGFVAYGRLVQLPL